MRYIPLLTLALIAFKLPEIIRAAKEPRSCGASSVVHHNKAALDAVTCNTTELSTTISSLGAAPVNGVSFTVFAPAFYPDVRVTLETPASAGDHRDAELDMAFLTALAEAATESITTQLGGMVAHAAQHLVQE